MIIERSGSPPRLTKSTDMLILFVLLELADFGLPLKTNGGLIKGRDDFDVDDIDVADDGQTLDFA